MVHNLIIFSDATLYNAFLAFAFAMVMMTANFDLIFEFKLSY